MMLESMRSRLTLWYTGVFALVLVIFALATYAYLARAAGQRIDDSLNDTVNSFVSSFTTELNDNEQPDEAAAIETAREFRYKDRQLLIYDAAHRLITASDAPATSVSKGKSQTLSVASLSVPLDALLDSASRTGRAVATLPDGAEGIRVIAVAVRSGASAYTVVVAHSLHAQEEALEQARNAFLVAIPLALLLASLGGYLLARKSLAPVLAMGERAAHIGASNLHERLPLTNERDELGRLARIFNELLARLEHSFGEQRRFMADASHELRTPVAIVRGEAEVALSQHERSGAEYRESLTIVEDEGRRLTRIVEDLFTLARADAGQYPLALTNFYLDDMVNDCVRSVRSLALKRGVELSYAQPGQEIPYYGDEGLLRRMILNLLDNALKHTRACGSIRVGLTTQKEGTCARSRLPTQTQVFPPLHSRTSLNVSIVRIRHAHEPVERMAAEQDLDYQSRCGSPRCTTVELCSIILTIMAATSRFSFKLHTKHHLKNAFLIFPSSSVWQDEQSVACHLFLMARFNHLK